MGCILLTGANKEGVTKGITRGMVVLELLQANPVKCFLFCFWMNPGLVAPAMGNLKWSTATLLTSLVQCQGTLPLWDIILTQMPSPLMKYKDEQECSLDLYCLLLSCHLLYQLHSQCPRWLEWSSDLKACASRVSLGPQPDVWFRCLE